MGFFDFLKKKDREELEPTLTSETIYEDPDPIQQAQQLRDTMKNPIPEGRDERNLGREEGLTAGAVAGGALAGGNALASGVAGAGGAGLAGEALSEQQPFSSDGTLGGNQRPTPPPPPPQETTFSADEGVPTNKPPDIPSPFANPFGALDELLSGPPVSDEVYAGMGGMTAEPLVPRPPPLPPDFDKFPDHPAQANAPANTDPAEHSLQITSSGKADPFIEGGKENPVDVSIFRQFLHIGAEYAFQYAKEQTGVAPIISIAERFAPFELRDVVGLAVDAVNKNKLTDIGSLRGTQPDRIKLLIKDVELQEHAIINNAVLYPLLVVAFKFYLADRDITTLKPSMMPDFVFKQGFTHILKKFVKLDDNKIRYFIWCWENTPAQLINAYKQNRQAITQIAEQDGVVIKKFVERIHEEYNRIFSPNTFLEDMKRYEHGGLELNQMLINLANPTFLFEVGQIYDGVDEFILNIQNNSGFLMGLMGLMYSFARNDGTTMGDALLGNARVDGIVYYNRRGRANAISNIEVELLKGATEPVSVREVDGINYIIFRGTDFRGGDARGEFMKNILNIAGSNELFSNPTYNSRLQQATQELMKLQAEGKRVKIIAYSLGTIFASRLSALFPRVPTSLYSMVLADNENTKKFMEKYSNQNPNVNFFAIENDPISVNLQKYKDKFNIKYTNKSRFFDNHKLENYLFNI